MLGVFRARQTQGTVLCQRNAKRPSVIDAIRLYRSCCAIHCQMWVPLMLGSLRAT
jgi:hypothetical protein